MNVTKYKQNFTLKKVQIWHASSPRIPKQLFKLSVGHSTLKKIHQRILANLSSHYSLSGVLKAKHGQNPVNLQV